MYIIKPMPEANEGLEGIWYYSYHHSGGPQTDRYVERLSDVLQILSSNNIGTPRSELGEGTFTLSFEHHVTYFLQPPEEATVICILNQNQDATRHLHRS